ncbi:MAG: glycosyltransferase, partial [candidate division Zixibacteria bacterium]|nr:glycosyltransferase [candidate division Zixibacteria bacterium]
MNPIRVIIAGGGTGGHFYPALAIARKLTMVLGPDSCEITFIGTKRGIEYKKRDSLEFPIKFINVRGIVRSLSFKNLLFPFALIGALLKTDAIM